MPRGKRESVYMATTTKSPAETAGDIQALIGKHGARQVLTEYDANGEISGISFVIDVNGQLIPFKPQIRWERLLEKMTMDPKTQNRYCTPEQARRSAWRIAFHWLEAQLAYVDSGMVSFLEIMLPFAQIGGEQTVFEQLEEKHFKMLPDYREKEQS